MQKLIECVPNFSEGRDPDIIRQITDAIASADGVSLLDVDPGATTNRTVVTFVGTPEAAVEGAFRGIQKAAELIDMRKHKGAHPRGRIRRFFRKDKGSSLEAGFWTRIIQPEVGRDRNRCPRIPGRLQCKLEYQNG